MTMKNHKALAAFTDEQKAEMVKAAQFAHAQPALEGFRDEFKAELTRLAQRRAAQEFSAKAGPSKRS